MTPALTIAAVKPLPLAGAALLVIFLLVRWRRLEPLMLIGSAIVAVALLVFGSGVVPLPDVKKLIEDLGSTLGRWTYLVVGAMAFLETGAFVGLVAPGETFMILGGVIAGQGTVSLIGLIGIGWTCAVLGDVASFWAGRKLGRGFLERHGPKVQITPERIAVVDRFFDRHGGKAILLGRFMGLVRAVNPFLAGASGLRFSRFLPYSILGAGMWASLLLVLGYVFWRSFDQVLHYAEQGLLALAAIIVVLVGVVWGVRYFRVAEHRRRFAAAVDRTLDRPRMRPVAAVVRPLWHRTTALRQFLVARLTPGGIGLEVTTLLAILAVGAYAFIGYAIALRDVVVTPGDVQAARIAHQLHTGWLEQIAKILTYLGSAWVLLPVTLLFAAVLVARWRTRHAVALVVGGTATWIVVQIAKALFDRPRPDDALVTTVGASFPSGHAAYSVGWIAIAVVIAYRLDGVGRPALIVAAGILLAAIAGLTRIYLRAHYLSDVVAGWGLGASIYSICGLAAVIGLHVRQNGRPDE